jgi:hypothetical protein
MCKREKERECEREVKKNFCPTPNNDSGRCKHNLCCENDYDVRRQVVKTREKQNKQNS